jgi:hypothetical protein
VKKQEDIAVAVNVTNNKLDELNDKADDLLHIASNIEWGITARLDLLMEKYEQEKRKHDEERKELLEREKLAEGQYSHFQNEVIGMKLSSQTYYQRDSRRRGKRMHILLACAACPPCWILRFNLLQGLPRLSIESGSGVSKVLST